MSPRWTFDEDAGDLPPTWATSYTADESLDTDVDNTIKTLLSRAPCPFCGGRQWDQYNADNWPDEPSLHLRWRPVIRVAIVDGLVIHPNFWAHKSTWVADICRRCRCIAQGPIPTEDVMDF